MSAPDSLREKIARDLKPVKPLRSPLVRALALVPLAAAIVFAVPALQFFRSDIGSLGPVRGWGLSYAQALAGIVIVALALRESIPGRALSRAVLAWTIAGGLAIPAVVLAVTASTFDIGPALASPHPLWERVDPMREAHSRRVRASLRGYASLIRNACIRG